MTSLPFYDLLKFGSNLFFILYNTAYQIFEIMTMRIGDLVGTAFDNLDLPWFGKILEAISGTRVSDMTLFGLLFGSALFIVIIVNFVKWVLDIVT